ncbi:MAG: glycoside hydrolase family 43 protein [Bacteroidaceae bacterium]|nr:glycoside hydrolase family 43 protein [Bacteroidaceae bacterium]
MKRLILSSLILMAVSISSEAQVCNDLLCHKCKLEAAVNYQFNALRLGEIELPTTIDGKAVNYRFSPIIGNNYSGVRLEGNKLITYRMPKDTVKVAGRLHCTIDEETFYYTLKVAKDDGMYGYLYCHMAGNSENTIYALGTKEGKGEVFHPLIDNQPIFDPEKIAGIEGGVRDAFIARGHNNDYVMVNTDMSNAKSRVWNNYGIDLLHSNDLIHWTSVTFDFRKFKGWENVNRVWAPQVIWDKDYDNGKGGYFIYYSMLTNQKGDYDKIYYSYANEDFTTITEPKLFYDKNISVIDCHIDWNDCDQRYHVFYKKEGAAGIDRGVWGATFDRLGSSDWKDIFHITNEGREQVEGASAFRLINENVWKIAYIKYSGQHVYRVCTANAQENDVDRGVVIRENVNPQHGSFMQVTKEEYDLLETWSRLYLMTQELAKDRKTAKKAKKLQGVLDTTFSENAVPQLLQTYSKALKGL